MPTPLATIERGAAVIWELFGPRTAIGKGFSWADVLNIALQEARIKTMLLAMRNGPE